MAAYESIVGGLRDTASKESSGYCGHSWYEHETLSRDLARLVEVFVVLEPALVFYEELGSGRRNYKFVEWINSLLLVAFIINPFERSVYKLDDIVILNISERSDRGKINFYCFGASFHFYAKNLNFCNGKELRFC